MFIFFIVIIFFLFILYVIGQFSITKKGEYLFKVDKKIISEYKPKINDKVNFWLNEKTYRTHIYFKGSHSGQGKISETTDSYLRNLILKDIDFDGFIYYISEDEIGIKIIIYEN